jgi:hypothetical protein
VCSVYCVKLYSASVLQLYVEYMRSCTVCVLGTLKSCLDHNLACFYAYKLSYCACTYNMLCYGGTQVNHITRTTQWERPTASSDTTNSSNVKPAVKAHAVADSKRDSTATAATASTAAATASTTAEAFEKRQTPDGREYFVNHTVSCMPHLTCITCVVCATVTSQCMQPYV